MPGRARKTNGRIGRLRVLQRTAGATVISFALATATTAWGGSIFDDDWTPPVVPKSVEKPAPPSAPPPVSPQTGAPRESSAHAPPTVPPTTAPTAPVESPASAAVPARRPVPEMSAQRKSRQLFKEVYAKELADRSPAARRALATQLIEKAAETKDVPADEFVLLVGATDAGREAADLAVCAKAADALASDYDVDGLHIKSEAALRMAFRGLPRATAAEDASATLALVDELVSADDYVTALRLLQSLRALQGSDPSLPQQLQARTREVEALHAAAAGVAKHRATLKASPDDPAANLAVGQYLCFLKGDWANGLPMLVKGSDAALKALAEKDLANPEGEAAAELADEWWQRAEKEPDPMKARLHERSALWYRVALPTLSGLSRTLAEKRIKDVPVAKQSIQVTNATTAREGSAILGEVAAKFPDAVAGVRRATLLKFHDAAEIKKSGEFESVAGAYSPHPVVVNDGGTSLWGVYEAWPAGRYLIVYRLQAIKDLSGDDTCFIDVAHNGKTIAGKHVAGSDLKAGQWTAYPDPLTLGEKTKIEYRFWAHRHAFAVDRVYVYRLDE